MEKINLNKPIPIAGSNLTARLIYTPPEENSVITSPVELPELVMKVSKWAQDRGLDDSALVKAQFVKLIEEVGELASDVARGRDPRDSIGDTLVVLIILAQQLETTLSECLTVAYNQIKDRTGKMVDGVFVKDEERG